MMRVKKDYDHQQLFFDVLPRAAFDVLVPRTWAKMEQGLQRLPMLEAGQGMLFLSQEFPEEEPIAMWQASVPYSLDMIWLGKATVAHIEHEVQPGDRKTYEYDGVAVLEVRGRTCERLGIRLGTRWTY